MPRDHSNLALVTAERRCDGSIVDVHDIDQILRIGGNELTIGTPCGRIDLTTQFRQDGVRSIHARVPDTDGPFPACGGNPIAIATPINGSKSVGMFLKVANDFARVGVMDAKDAILAANC